MTTFEPEIWRRELVTFVRRMGARDDAEDLVQEAFLRALSAPPRSHPRAWLYRTVLNVLRDRRRGPVPVSASDLLEPPDRRPGPAERAEGANLARVAWDAVGGLPERQRLAIILRIQRHMDYDEISIALACSVPCARQHFHLGIKAVRDAMGRVLDER